MNRIKFQVNSTILHTIYNSLIHSHLHYGILCWGLSGSRLFKLQKKAVRIICKKKYNAHTDPLFKSLKILKIEDIYKLQSLKFYFGLENKILPSYFLSNFKLGRSSDIHEHNLRSSAQFRQENVQRQSTKKTLRLNLPILLNSTPNELLGRVNTHSLDNFKLRVKYMYINGYQAECTKVDCYVCSR